MYLAPTACCIFVDEYIIPPKNDVCHSLGVSTKHEAGRVLMSTYEDFNLFAGRQAIEASTGTPVKTRIVLNILNTK